MPCAAAMPTAWIPAAHAADASRIRHDVIARPCGECLDHGLRSIEIFTDLHRYGERSGDRCVAGVIVVTDRLLEPGNAFGFEGASAADRLGDSERLVVIDRQLDGVGKPLAHRPGDREVLLEVGMAEPQLHREEPASEQLLVRCGLRRT